MLKHLVWEPVRPTEVEVVNLPSDPWFMDWLPLLVAVFAAVLAVAIQSWRDDKRHWRQSVREAYERFALVLHEDQVNASDMEATRAASARARERVVEAQQSQLPTAKMTLVLEDAYEAAREHTTAARAALISAGQLNAALAVLEGLVSDKLAQIASRSLYEVPANYLLRALAKGIAAEVHPYWRKRRAFARQYATFIAQPEYVAAFDDAVPASSKVQGDRIETADTEGSTAV